MKKYLVALSILMIAGAVIVFQNCTPSVAASPPVDGSIRGLVYTEVRDSKEQKAEMILLNDVIVIIKDSLGNVLDSTITNPDGSYQTKKIKKGKQKICLSRQGFTLSCYDVNVSKIANYPGPLKLNYSTSDYIWGKVKLKDNSIGFYRQYVFGVDIHTDVMISAGGAVPNDMKTRCSAYGYYIFMNANKNIARKITAVCQNAVASDMLDGRSNINLTFANTRPVINYITAYDSAGNAIIKARPGQKIKLVASVTDSENHHIRYQWRPSGSSPGFVPVNNNTVVVTLPAGDQLYVMDLMIFDEYGGADYKSFNIEEGDEMMVFSGTANNIDGSGRIDSAKVTVNGQYVTYTDAHGYFYFKVPRGPKYRYVLNIEKPGYSLCSKIYFTEAIGKEYRLVKMTTQSFDPTKDIVLVEKEDRYTKFTNRKQDDNRQGAKIMIPANSIVDSLGHLVHTTVNVSLRTVNLSDPNGLMPGDMGALQGGQDKTLESFGAVDVQIRDSVNPKIKYKLKPDAAAEVNLPLTTKLQATSKPDISLWDYNDSTGVWMEIGIAHKTGAFYKGTTSKFSVINTDLAKSNATLIRLIDNPTNTVFVGTSPAIEVRVIVPQTNGGAVLWRTLTNVQPSDVTPALAVVRLPPDTIITIQIIRNDSTLNVLNVRTGPSVPGTANANPAPPYNLPGAVTVKMLPDNVNTASSHFFERLTSNSSDANKYYTLIGAYDFGSAGHHITFTEWKNKNGFTADGSGDVNTVYFNAGDLRFWRGMHWKQGSGSTMAYYVSNFRNDVDAIFNHNVLASVCMEYNPVVAGGGNVNVIKYYVFKGENLDTSANLDGNGEKCIPNLCNTCHGGETIDYNSFATANDLQAEFNLHTANEMPNYLPFDAKSFFYSVASGNTRPDMEDRLRQLNDHILSTDATAAIKQFINTSYNNHAGTIGQGFIDNATVPGWAINSPIASRNNVIPAHLYQDVIGTSCRTCHMARASDGLWFDDTTKLIGVAGSIQFAVCGTSDQKYMPNSKVTFANFWSSEAPSKPDSLKAFLRISTCPAP